MYKSMLSWLIGPVPIVFLSSVLSWSCVTPDASELPPLLAGQTIPGEVKYFRLVKERGVDFAPPMAQYIPLYLEMRDDSRLLGRYLKYMAWDFDRDGSPELLEELDPQFHVISRSYDFSLPRLEDDFKRIAGDAP